jgi:hypothetical protein
MRLDLYILMLTPIAMITSDYNSVSKPLPPTPKRILLDEAKIIADVGHRTANRSQSLGAPKE